MRHPLFALAFLTVFGTPSLAFAQTTAAAQPAAPALPSANEIAAICGALPPADRPLPSLTPAARLSYGQALVSGNTAYGGGPEHFMEALQWRWAAYRANPAPDVGEDLIVALRSVGVRAEPYRCAIVSCLAPRMMGQRRTELETERNACQAVISTPTPTPTTTERFVAEGDTLRAILADTTGLAAAIRQDGAADTGNAARWQVPVAFRERVNRLAEAYRLAHAQTSTTLTTSRSVTGYVVPGVLAGAGLVLGAVAISQTVAFGRATARLDDANQGRTQTGWSRDDEVEADNARIRQAVFYPAAAACFAGAVVTWFAFGPHAPVAVTPTMVGPQHAGLALSGSF